MVNGAYIPGRWLAQTLYEVGFRKSGTVVHEYESNGNCVQVQPLTCDIRDASSHWSEQHARCVERLSANGYILSQGSEIES